MRNPHDKDTLDTQNITSVQPSRELSMKKPVASFSVTHNLMLHGPSRACVNKPYSITLTFACPAIYGGANHAINCSGVYKA